MELLSVKDTSELLKVDRRTVYRMIERGELPAFKVGRQWRLRAGDLEDWIEAQLQVRESSGTYQTAQTLLFEEATDEKTGKTNFRDSAFSENNGLPLHGWASWIAGFSAKFVADVLDTFLGNGEALSGRQVLDPFAGVGTTLVTAMMRGHNSWGFEINPYAAEVCRLKLAIDRINSADLEETVSDFEKSLRNAITGGREPRSNPPEGFVTRSEFFSPAVERKVLLVKDYVDEIDDCWPRGCFRIALASQIVSFSNYSYEPSLCRRKSAGKRAVHDAPVATAVAGKVRRMLRDIKKVHGKMVGFGGWPTREFRAADFFQECDGIPDGGIDLVVTSPPYLNNYHYIRNSRPQVYWLGLADSPSDLKSVEEGSFGKYWQTVRGADPIDLDFPMDDLAEDLQRLRERNEEKGQYGGPGWANYAATYFNDVYRFAQELARVLNEDGRAVIVLGNSILQGIEFKTDAIFGDICETCGMAVEGIELLRRKRTGSSIIKSSVRSESAREKVLLYESAVILSKR